MTVANDNGGVDASDDPAIQNGLKCLGGFISQSKAAAGIQRVGGRNIDAFVSNLYFMWSVERVGVIYGLETIGNNDWYAWGSDALVKSQNADGSWTGSGYPGATPELSTCFALLFLSRANVAKDLTAKLQGKIKDPGVSTLKGRKDITQVLPDRSQPAPTPAPTLPPTQGDVTHPLGIAVASTEPVPVSLIVDPPSATVTGDDFDSEAKRLTDAMVGASATYRPTLLVQLRDTKGGVYTEALARSAARLNGEQRQQVREALARRLTRMTAASLREMLKDDNLEVRCGAAAAVGIKGDRELFPNLIDALSDADALVMMAARTSLRTLSGKDFGPEAEASAENKTQAANAWRTWWAVQPK